MKSSLFYLSSTIIPPFISLSFRCSAANLQHYPLPIKVDLVLPPPIPCRPMPSTSFKSFLHFKQHCFQSISLSRAWRCPSPSPPFGLCLSLSLSSGGQSPVSLPSDLYEVPVYNNSFIPPRLLPIVPLLPLIHSTLFPITVPSVRAS